MIRMSVAAAAFVSLTMMSFIVSPASAAGTCRQTCDERHVDCARSKPEGICLDAWRQCKTTCAGGQKAVTPVAQPVKVTTTTTITPGAGGSKVVATNTKISKK